MASRAAFVVLAVLAGSAHAQTPAKIRVGLYAPSVEFGTAQARLVYVQGLAKAIEQSTGVKTEAQSYGSLAALLRDQHELATRREREHRRRCHAAVGVVLERRRHDAGAQGQEARVRGHRL
jgi:hypothetical protein